MEDQLNALLEALRMEDVQSIEISCIVIKDMVKKKPELVNEALRILGQLFNALYYATERILESLCSLIEVLLEDVDFPSIQSRFGSELKTGLFVKNSTIQRLAIVVTLKGLTEETFSMELFNMLLDQITSENVTIYQLILERVLSSKLSMRNRLHLIKRLDFLYEENNNEPVIQMRIVDFLLRLKYFSWPKLGNIIKSQDMITCMIVQESLACNVENDKEVSCLELGGILKIISEMNDPNYINVLVEILSKSSDKDLVYKYMPSERVLELHDRGEGEAKKEVALFGMGKLSKFYNEQVQRKIINLLFEELNSVKRRITVLNSLTFIVKNDNNDSNNNNDNIRDDCIREKFLKSTMELMNFCTNNIDIPLKKAAYQLIKELLTHEWYLKDADFVIECILNRSLDSSHQGLVMKYDIIKRLSDESNPIIDSDKQDRIRKYLDQGIYYAPKESDIAMEHD